MTRWTSRNRKRKARALDTLQEKGLTACALGAAMLVGGLLLRLLRQRGKPMASQARVVDAQYHVVPKTGQPLLR